MRVQRAGGGRWNFSVGRGCASLQRGVPGRDRGQTGDGESCQVRYVQHPEWKERGYIIVTSRDGTGMG